jgi:hypothetical protein
MQVVLVMAAFFAVIVAAAVWWERRKAARKFYEAEGDMGGPPPRPVMIRGAWLYLVLLGGFFLVFWNFLPKRVPAGADVPPPPANSRLTLGVLLILAAPAVLFLLFLAYVLWRMRRNYDPAASRALEKANAGDVEGAIAEVQTLVQAKGMTGPRATALGVLHFIREEWDEAARWFEEAERLGVDKQSCAMNKAMIRHKSGHPEDALPVLRSLWEKDPSNTVAGCNLCQVLVDLGRVDEARSVLVEVDRRRKQSIPLGADARAKLDRLVEECRARLEGKPKTDLSALDEL